jgi:hypothetical protein
MRRNDIPNLSVLTTVMLVTLSGSALSYASVANAGDAPPQLYSKTITVSYSATMAGGTLAAQRVIYVSSKGRIFVRRTRSGGGVSDSKDLPLENYSYSGGRIIGYHPFSGERFREGSGAQQVTISFDPSFHTCTASLRYGKSSGQPYRIRVPNGKIYSSDSAPTVSGISCAIKDGNPFGE